MVRWKYVWPTSWCTRQTPRVNQPPLEHTTTHNTTTKNSIKHCHHRPPKPPASNGFNFTGECDHHMCIAIDHDYRNTAMYFILTTLTFPFLFNCYSMCSGSACSLTKGEFLKLYLVMFLCHCIKTMCTNPSYPAIPYLVMLLENSSCFGLILDGGGRHCQNVFLM